jgi:AmmeMemoRadiSam system protein A
MSVRDMAAAAAVRDDRFPPVTSEELPALDVEISVLSPRRRIDGPQDVVVGRDGLYIRRGIQSGLLLPQVALEHEWDGREFLAQVCRKAGLPADAWQDPAARVESFTAEVFGEPDSAPAP